MQNCIWRSLPKLIRLHAYTYHCASVGLLRASARPPPSRASMGSSVQIHPPGLAISIYLVLYLCLRSNMYYLIMEFRDYKKMKQRTQLHVQSIDLLGLPFWEDAFNPRFVLMVRILPFGNQIQLLGCEKSCGHPPPCISQPVLDSL